MFRLAAPTLAALLLAPWVTAHPVPTRPSHAEASAAALASFQGRVLAVTQDQLTLWTRGSTKQFVVGGDTLVLVNGTGGVLRDVRPGYAAEVTSISQDGKAKAQVIEAFIAH